MLRKIPRTALTSCWTESGHESSLMWKAYAGSEGIAVRTTFQNLQDSIRSVAELPVTFGQVEYVDYRRNEVPRFGWAPLFHKRTEYREEGEVRAILPGSPWDVSIQQGVPETHIPRDSDVAEQRGRYIPVDLEILVQEIVLPPHAAPWFAQVVKSVMDDSPARSRVTRSSIESPPTCVEPMNYRMTPQGGNESSQPATLHNLLALVGPVGFEPTTRGLKVRCSASRAMDGQPQHPGRNGATARPFLMSTG